MKLYKVLILLVLFLLPLSAVGTTRPMKLEPPVFMGKVKEVIKEKDGSYRLLVTGYIKGCEIYPEELIAFITKDTEILQNKCNEVSKKKTLEDLNVEAGDNVYLVLSNAMTKSIPPQVSARKIQLTKAIN